ncbi:hypothetical protein Tco_0550565 [Tanacetum coccineum]
MGHSNKQGLPKSARKHLRQKRNISSEQKTLKLADHVEDSMYTKAINILISSKIVMRSCVWQQAFRSDKRLAASGVAKHTLRVLCIARVLEGIVVSVLINLIQFCSTKIPIKTIPFASKEEIATLLALWKWGSESIRIWWQGVPCSSKPPEK